MIETVLSRAVSDINSYYDANEQLRNNQTFALSITKLDQAVQRLNQLLTLYEQLVAKGLPVEGLLRKGIRDSLLVLLDDCGRKVAGRYLDSQSVLQLDREIIALDERLCSIWLRVVQTYAGNIPDSLHNMKALLEDPNRAGVIVEKIHQLQTKWPLTYKDITEFISLVHEGQSLLATVQIDNEDVRRFIEKLRNQQATIADLNQNVLDWIRKYNLESRIKVSFDRQ